MVTHRRALVIGVASFFALVAACDKVPLLAPTGSVISLILSTTNASLNSEVSVVATVIENGQAVGGSGGAVAARPGVGTPVQNGTLITFTTTIGTIEPSEARTHNGQVTVKLLTGTTSGTAVITAYSGGASQTNNQLKVGTAAAKLVNVTTTPQALGASGGSAQVVVTVVDEGGNGIGGVPVALSTDKGSISPTTVTSDASGSASAVLTTTATAKVTATLGVLPAVSGSATVTVSARSLASFIASTPATTTGVTVGFTVTPTTGANISNVHVEFGDGRFQDTGPITIGTSVPHAYTSSGVYTATATASGETPLTATVSISQLGITLSAAPNPGTAGAPVTFTVGNLATAQVDHYEWAFDDGTTAPPTSGPQTTHIFTTRGVKTARVDAFGVSGGKIGTATLSMNVQ